MDKLTKLLKTLEPYAGVADAAGDLYGILRRTNALDPRRIVRPAAVRQPLPERAVFKHAFTPEEETMEGRRRLQLLRKNGDRCLTIDHAVPFCLEPNLFPKGWRRLTKLCQVRCVLFDATVLEASEDFFRVIFLYWDPEEDRLRCGERWLDLYYEYEDERPYWEFATPTFHAGRR